jgi:hypothetical protein
MVFKVESGIDLIPSAHVYPFGEMRVGDSFFVRDSGGSRTPRRSSASSSAVAYGRNHPGYKFSVRAVEGGFRVWRVEPKKAGG